VEWVLLTLGPPPIEYKILINKWTRRFIIAGAFRRIPFYSADYLVFSSFGFFGRDTELVRIVTRKVFNYPIVPGEPLSILFEGRNVIGEDSYGRPAPDIIRKPWQIGRMAIEASRDLVDETYRTQNVSQRVDNVYLGILERKIFEWLAVRSQDNFTSFDQRSFTQEKFQNEIPVVREPIRKGFKVGVTPRVNSKLLLSGRRIRRNIDRSLDRFNRWFRAISQNTVSEDQISGFSLSHSRKIPESLFVLSTRNFSERSYLASVGLLEPQRTIRYSNRNEFNRKRNARRSPLHRRPIIRYIDILFKTRSKTKGFMADISTRQQQYELFRARSTLQDYILASRRYSIMEEQFSNPDQKSIFFGTLAQRFSWQRELYSHLFGDSRSRSNSLYNQQYVGNLQLVRRLFSISWEPQEQQVPINKKRRKFSLDQRTFDRQKNIFEHEEFGKVIPLKVENIKERKQVFNELNLVGVNSKLGNWILRPKKRYFRDTRVEIKPIYAGWDQTRHALVLCNRFLPIEWAIRTKLANKYETKLKTNLSAMLNNFENYRRNTARREFRVWPQNLLIRRMRIRNVRYNIRVALQRTNLSVLSHDRVFWRRKAIGLDGSRHAFWINPRSRNSIRTNQQVRSSQNFPLSFERGIRQISYVPGDFQPSNRGGLIWPGTDPFLFVPKNFTNLDLI